MKRITVEDLFLGKYPELYYIYCQLSEVDSRDKKVLPVFTEVKGWKLDSLTLDMIKEE